MGHITLLLSLFVTLIVVLALTIESGRAAERVRLIVGAVVASLVSSVTLAVSVGEAAAFRQNVERMVRESFQLGQSKWAATSSKPAADINRAVFLKDCEACPKLVAVHGGTYQMGWSDYLEQAPSEGPPRLISVGGFALGRTEVTRGEFGQFVSATGYRTAAGCETRAGFNPGASWQAPGFPQTELHPVVCVGHQDALAYIEWLNAQTGRTYRLPSEAEWEYAARLGGEEHALQQLAKAHAGPNVANPRGVTLPVGLMAANRLGLVDMTGNAAELVADCWVPDLSQLPVDGTAMSATGEQPCTTGVRRGTSWRSQVTDVRPSKRDVGGPSSSTGFRVARDLALSERSGIGALASPTFAEVAGQTASR